MGDIGDPPQELGTPLALNMSPGYNVVTTVQPDFTQHDPSSSGSSEMVAVTVIRHYILPIICSFGILGIILTVIVLSRKNMCTSTNCHLTALAIADLLFLVLLATRLIDNQLTPFTQSFYYFSIYMSYAVIFMLVFLMASIWLTVMLAVERYIAICQPFLAAKVCSVNNARLFIVLIYIFSLIVRIPAFCEQKVVTHFDPDTNTSITYVTTTSLNTNPTYQRIYPWVVNGFLMSIIPFLMLLILNVRLIWEVRKSTRYLQATMVMAAPGRSSGTAQKEELQITIMLISIIIVFFICQAPYVVYTAILSINSFKYDSAGLLLFQNITIVVLALKSAVNFIIYCWFSEKFWQTLKKIFCQQRACARYNEKNSQNGSYYNLRRYSNCTRDTTI